MNEAAILYLAVLVGFSSGVTLGVKMATSDRKAALSATRKAIKIHAGHMRKPASDTAASQRREMTQLRKVKSALRGR